MLLCQVLPRQVLASEQILANSWSHHLQSLLEFFIFSNIERESIGVENSSPLLGYLFLVFSWSFDDGNRVWLGPLWTVLGEKKLVYECIDIGLDYMMGKYKSIELNHDGPEAVISGNSSDAVCEDSIDGPTSASSSLIGAWGTKSPCHTLLWHWQFLIKILIETSYYLDGSLTLFFVLFQPFDSSWHRLSTKFALVKSILSWLCKVFRCLNCLKVFPDWVKPSSWQWTCSAFIHDFLIKFDCFTIILNWTGSW